MNHVDVKFDFPGKILNTFGKNLLRLVVLAFARIDDVAVVVGFKAVGAVLMQHGKRLQGVIIAVVAHLALSLSNVGAAVQRV